MPDGLIFVLAILAVFAVSLGHHEFMLRRRQREALRRMRERRGL